MNNKFKIDGEWKDEFSNAFIWYSDLKIVSCAYSTDGTVLKPTIEYDPLSKQS